MQDLVDNTRAAVASLDSFARWRAPHRRVARGLAGLAVALALAACGGGGDHGSQDGQGSALTVTTVTGPDGSSIAFPESAFVAPVTVRIAKDSQDAPPLPSLAVPAGDTFRVTPHGQALQLTAILQIPFDPSLPADAPLAVAESHGDGIWTLRTDTQRKGANLEVVIARLGHFRAVTLPPVSARAAIRSGRRQPLSVGPNAGSNVYGHDINLQASGFVQTFAYLTNPTPYDGPALVSVTAELESRGYCPMVTSIDVWQSNVLTGSAHERALPVQWISLQPPQAGPWTFDLRIYRPPWPGGSDQMLARISFECLDEASGAYFFMTAKQTISYRVADGAPVGFLSSPADVIVETGETAHFQVQVLGGPEPPSYSDQYDLTWERMDPGGDWRSVGFDFQSEAIDVSPLLGRTHELRMANVADADSGALIRATACYRAPGSQRLCRTSETAQLTLSQFAVEPSITQQPRSMATLVGETAAFTVGVAGVPPPTIRWQVLPATDSTWVDVGPSGVDWPGATPTAATLVTPPGTLGWDGWLFRAVLTGAYGSTLTSDPAVWRVTELPLAPTITVQPASTSVPLGSTAIFAIAAEGTAPLSYQWTKDGVPVSGATSPVIAIGNVQAASLGNYLVTVSGPGGSVSSTPAALVAGSGTPAPTPPSITAQPASRTVSAGLAATFTVGVAGSPAPVCQWTRNGIVIPSAASCDSYTTLPATATDNGAVYNVVATNAGGSAFAGGAVLTVQGTAPPSSWTFLPSGTGVALYDIAIVAGDPARVVAVGLDGAILRSTDGGATWTRAYAPPSNGLRSLFKLRFVDALVGVAVGNSDIVRTADGGATWSRVWTAEVEGAAYGQQYLQAVDWLDADTAIAVGGVGRVWRSTDRGQTWQVLGSFDFGPVAGNVGGMRFADAQVGLVASNYKLFRTTDGGATWGELPGSFSFFTDPLYGVVRGSTAQILVAAGGSGIYRSSDAGATWTRTGVESGGYLLGLVAHGKDMAAVGERGLVLRSSDDGASWTPGPTVPFGQLWGVDFTGQTTFVSGSGGVVARHD